MAGGADSMGQALLGTAVLLGVSAVQRYDLKRGRRPNKLTDCARQLLLMVRRWVPERPIVVVAESSFAALELLDAVRHKLCTIQPRSAYPVRVGGPDARDRGSQH